MFSFFKLNFFFYWFIWSLVLIHLNVFVRAYLRRASTCTSTQKKCPFTLSQKYFNSPTVAIANTIFSEGFRNVVPSLNPMVLSMQMNSKLWTNFHHIHHGKSSPFSIACNTALYSTVESVSGGIGTHYVPPMAPTPPAPSYYDPTSFTNALTDNPPSTSSAKKRPDEGKSKLDDLQVVVIGLSHHNSKVDIREKLAIPEHEWNEVSKQLIEKYDSIAEASVISTCNRFEIYLAGENQYEVIRDAMQFLMERSQNSLDLLTLRKYLFMLSGEDAMWHLFRVASGLDSLIVGEGQILAQVKKAYDHSMTNGAPGGKVISRLFNIAIAAGKRVRTETGISRGAVSISSAAAEFTAMQLKTPNYGPIETTPKSLAEAKIVLIGAGKMARLLLVHLESQGVTSVTIVNRSKERIVELQAEFPTLTIQMEGMDSLWDVLETADICYPCTASTTTIINPEPLDALLAKRTKKSPLQIVDISVPRNVHPDCEALTDKYVQGFYNYNVDHLKVVVQQNTHKRKREILQADEILKDELNRFQLWQQSLGAIPTIAKLQEKAESMRQEEVLKGMKKFSSNLSNKDIELVERITKGIVAKLLHGPMSHLRQQKESDATRMAIQQVQQAFQLGEH